MQDFPVDQVFSKNQFIYRIPIPDSSMYLYRMILLMHDTSLTKRPGYLLGYRLHPSDNEEDSICIGGSILNDDSQVPKQSHTQQKTEIVWVDFGMLYL